jgi:hypothetical protein
MASHGSLPSDAFDRLIIGVPALIVGHTEWNLRPAKSISTFPSFREEPKKRASWNADPLMCLVWMKSLINSD